MKTSRLFLGSAVALACAACLCSCSLSDDGEEARKVLSSSDYAVTVASHRLEGVVTSSGSNIKTQVMAIKKDGSDAWQALYGIQGFDYEEGYEYRLRINETCYLDYRMGDPAWTEHTLIEVVSKEKKDTEGLPAHLIPIWYQNWCGQTRDSLQNTQATP